MTLFYYRAMKKIILRELLIEDRVALLTRAFDLKHQGVSLTAIGNELNLHLGTISRWFNFKRCPFGRFNYASLEPSTELAWLVGLILGDGSIRIKKHKDGNYHVIQLQMSKHNCFLVEKGANVIGKLLGKQPPIYSWRHPLAHDEMYGWDICHKQFYEYLEPAGAGNFIPLLPLIDNYPFDFLRGLYEADGWISIDPRGYKRIGFRNSSTALLALVQRLLESQGWHPHLNKNGEAGQLSYYKGHTIRKSKPCFQLMLGRQAEVAKFLQVTGLGKDGDAKWVTAAR